MSYNPFTDPKFQEKMKHFKETGDSSIFRAEDSSSESVKQRELPVQSVVEDSSAVHTDIISVTDTENTSSSPFDRIKHTDENGNDYWLARELQSVLGYDTWRRFEDTIKRAMQACRNVEGENGVSTRFVGFVKMVQAGTVIRDQQDYRLNRYACYLTAMNGDPSKPEIAAAQTYFVTDYNRLKEQESSVKEKSIIVTSASSSDNNPNHFDAIKHIDKDGEYWFARELQGLLGYKKWDKFRNVIEKGKQTCLNVGEDANYHIRQMGNMVSIGSGAQRETQDYRLTRYACYIIAMNGDSSKPEIAAAQTYFAVKTRQAELQQQPIQPLSQAQMFLQVAQILVKIEDEQKNQAEVQKQISQTVEKQSSQLQEIRNDINELQNFNRIECPPAIISKRCNNINGIIYKLDSTGKLSFNDSKQLAYDIIFNKFNLDVEQELEKYKVACRRYYEHYKIYNGTPPKDVLRPATIEKLGWVSWVSIKKEIYDAVLKELKNYSDED